MEESFSLALPFMHRTRDVICSLLSGRSSLERTETPMTTSFSAFELLPVFPSTLRIYMATVSLL